MKNGGKERISSDYNADQITKKYKIKDNFYQSLLKTFHHKKKHTINSGI